MHPRKREHVGYGVWGAVVQYGRNFEVRNEVGHNETHTRCKAGPDRSLPSNDKVRNRGCFTMGSWSHVHTILNCEASFETVV